MSAHASPRHRKPRSRGPALAAAAITVAAAPGILWALATPASADTCASAPGKCFLATVQPASFTSGASVPFSITISNETSGQSLGAANVTAPAGYSITHVGAPSTGSAALSGSTLQLRNLNLAPGGSVTENITADTIDGAGVWVATAKQSNDYNGTGNDLVLDPSSQLTTTGTKTKTCANPADVSCGTNWIDFSRPSSVSTGSAATAAVWLVGTANFPATSVSGGQFYSMHAPASPNPICPSTSTGSLTSNLINCTFEMDMDKVPAPYDSAHSVTLHLECDISKCPPAPVGSTSVFTLVKVGDNGQESFVPSCSSTGAGSLCYTTGVAADGNFTVTVTGIVAGDPQFGGNCIDGCYPSVNL